MFENSITVWVAPIITSLLVWYLTSKYGHKILGRVEKGNPQDKSEYKSHADLPLTVKIMNNEIPVGYYKLSEKTAKRMEPGFYSDMKSYIDQPLYIWLLSILMLIIAFSNFSKDPEFSSGLILWSLLIWWHFSLGDKYLEGK